MQSDFPNERLMIVNLVNFLIWTILQIIVLVMEVIIISTDEKSSYFQELTTTHIILKCIYVVFNTYMYLFVLYLIWKFIRGTKDASIKDTILNRDVPSAVFIQN